MVGSLLLFVKGNRLENQCAPLILKRKCWRKRQTRSRMERNRMKTEAFLKLTKKTEKVCANAWRSFVCIHAHRESCLPWYVVDNGLSSAISRFFISPQWLDSFAFFLFQFNWIRKYLRPLVCVLKTFYRYTRDKKRM